MDTKMTLSNHQRSKAFNTLGTIVSGVGFTAAIIHIFNNLGNFNTQHLAATTAVALTGVFVTCIGAEFDKKAKRETAITKYHDLQLDLKSVQEQADLLIGDPTTFLKINADNNILTYINNVHNALKEAHNRLKPWVNEDHKEIENAVENIGKHIDCIEALKSASITVNEESEWRALYEAETSLRTIQPAALEYILDGLKDKIMRPTKDFEYVNTTSAILGFAASALVSIADKKTPHTVSFHTPVDAKNEMVVHI